MIISRPYATKLKKRQFKFWMKLVNADIFQHLRQRPASCDEIMNTSVSQLRVAIIRTSIAITEDQKRSIRGFQVLMISETFLNVSNGSLSSVSIHCDIGNQLDVGDENRVLDVPGVIWQSTWVPSIPTQLNEEWGNTLLEDICEPRGRGTQRISSHVVPDERNSGNQEQQRKSLRRPTSSTSE